MKRILTIACLLLVASISSFAQDETIMTCSKGNLYMGDKAVSLSDLKSIYPDMTFNYKLGRGVKFVGVASIVVGGANLVYSCALIAFNPEENSNVVSYGMLSGAVTEILAGSLLCHWGNKLIASISDNYNKIYLTPSSQGVGIALNF